MRRSQAAAIASPPPMAKPSTTASVGIGNVSTPPSGAVHLLLVGDAVLAATESLELRDVGAGDERLAAGAAEHRDPQAVLSLRCARRSRRAARTSARSWRCAPPAGRRSPWQSCRRGRNALLRHSCCLRSLLHRLDAGDPGMPARWRRLSGLTLRRRMRLSAPSRPANTPYCWNALVVEAVGHEVQHHDDVARAAVAPRSDGSSRALAVAMP